MNATQKIEELTRQRGALNKLHSLCEGNEKAVGDILWAVVNSIIEVSAMDQLQTRLANCPASQVVGSDNIQ